MAWVTDPCLTDSQCLMKSIAAIAFKRPLTPAELVLCARRLHHFFKTDDIVKKSVAIFNCELNIRFVEELLAIGDLPDPGLELLHQGKLSLQASKRLAACNEDTTKGFLTIFSAIKASINKQLEIIQYVMEIAARDHIKTEKFLKAKSIRDILSNENTDPVTKTNTLRSWLFEQRFPAIFNTHLMVQKKIASIKFNPHIKFLPPVNFESQNYSVSFIAKNYTEFARNVQMLNDALGNRQLEEIFDL